RRDDEDVRRDPDFVRDVLSEERDEQSRPEEHERRRDAHREPVGEHVRHRHRRAHPEELDEDGVLAADAAPHIRKDGGGRWRTGHHRRRARRRNRYESGDGNCGHRWPPRSCASSSGRHFATASLMMRITARDEMVAPVIVCTWLGFPSTIVLTPLSGAMRPANCAPNDLSTSTLSPSPGVSFWSSTLYPVRAPVDGSNPIISVSNSWNPGSAATTATPMRAPAASNPTKAFVNSRLSEPAGGVAVTALPMRYSVSQRTGSLSTSRTATSTCSAACFWIAGSVTLYTETTSHPAAAPATASVRSSFHAGSILRGSADAGAPCWC